MIEAAMRSENRRAALTVEAPAKVNLTLAVQGERADGFHSITSLVMGVRLDDELTFSPTTEAGVHLACDDPTIPVDERNLVVRAAMSLAERAAAPRGVRIGLRKRIPVAAGLGGGSSDCATTLRTLNSLWDVNLDDAELAELGACIGSDVPLFFYLPAAIVTGRGEQVRPVSLPWTGWVVLAHGGWPVSTAEVYANWRESDRRPEKLGPLDDLLSCRRAAELTPRLFNDLEPAICRTVPAVGDFQRRLTDVTGHAWRLSGAGSTAFAIFDTENEARRTAERIDVPGPAKRVMVVEKLSATTKQLC